MRTAAIQSRSQVETAPGSCRQEGLEPRPPGSKTAGHIGPSYKSMPCNARLIAERSTCNWCEPPPGVHWASHKLRLSRPKGHLVVWYRGFAHNRTLKIRFRGEPRSNVHH
jgi:hypothetical protein